MSECPGTPGDALWPGDFGGTGKMYFSVFLQSNSVFDSREQMCGGLLRAHFLSQFESVYSVGGF